MELFHTLCTKGIVEEAAQVFIPPFTKQLLGRRSGLKWTTCGFSQNWQDVNRWFEENPRTSWSYANLFKLLGFLGQSNLIDLYLQEMEQHQVDFTEQVFISAANSYALCQQWSQLGKLIMLAKEKGIEPTQTMTSMTVLSFIRSGNFDRALDILITGKLENVDENSVSVNTCRKVLPDGKALTVSHSHMTSLRTFTQALRNIPSEYDLVTWTCLLKGFFDQRKYLFCWIVFEHMLSQGMLVDEVACDIAIQACDALKRLSRAKGVYELLKNSSYMQPNAAIYSSLISCAASCANAEAAEDFYLQAVSRGTVLGYRAYFHLLRAYARTGNYEKALCVYHALYQLPRETLPSVHDWFLVFLSFRVVLQQYHNRYIAHPCAEYLSELEKIREAINQLGDKLLEEGRLLSKEPKHLYGVMERYFNIKMESERWSEALQILKDMSMDPNLPLHWKSTRFRLYVSWSRYICATGVTESKVFEALQAMESVSVELNELCVWAAMECLLKLNRPLAALDIFRCPFLLVDQIESIHTKKTYSNEQHRKNTLKRLYGLLQMNAPECVAYFERILQEKKLDVMLVDKEHVSNDVKAKRRHWNKMTQTEHIKLSQFETSDGIQLSYWQQGNGRPLVLLHGWSGSHRSFHKNLQVLSQSFKVIAPDLRGHGTSGQPKYGFHVSRLALDLCELLDHLNVDKDGSQSGLVVIGSSLGAAIIWSYVELFTSRRFAGVIFVDQSPWQMNASDGSWKLGSKTLPDYASLVHLKSMLEFKPESVFQQNVHGCLFREPSQKEVEFFVSIAKQADVSFLSKLMEDHANQDWRFILPLIHCPCLVIYGKQSKIFGEDSALYLADKLPRKMIQEFQFAGHWPYYEMPERFNEVIIDFIRNKMKKL
eukprot:jgi/Galph1/3419/GphlegSOOS_G2069.1